VLITCATIWTVGAISPTHGQIITFNGPLPWTTQRNDSITVRAQIDTAQVKKRQFALTIEVVNDRVQKKTIVQKTFPIKDYTDEFPAGFIKQNLIGGKSYIRLAWSIPGTADKGIIAPIGIAALDKLPPAEMISATQVQEGSDNAAVGSALKEGNFKSSGAEKFAFAWNKNAFYIVPIKGPATGSIRFAFDGKNGKNAFLSFADRVVMYMNDKDSLRGVRYLHQMTGDTLKYTEKPWPSELSKTVSGDKIVIRVPWYDVGIIPFDSRKFGIGIMAFTPTGEQSSAFPAGANFYNPGTWCDVQLAK